MNSILLQWRNNCVSCEAFCKRDKFLILKASIIHKRSQVHIILGWQVPCLGEIVLSGCCLNGHLFLRRVVFGQSRCLTRRGTAVLFLPREELHPNTSTSSRSLYYYDKLSPILIMDWLTVIAQSLNVLVCHQRGWKYYV